MEVIELAMILSTILYIGYRAEKIVRYKIDTLAKEPEKLKKPEPMPSDLVMLVNEQSEEWARAQTRKALEEMYAESGSWDHVRLLANEGH